MLSGSPPELRVPSGGSARRGPIRLTVEVLIDAAGQPDLRTLRITGSGVAENEVAIARWIRDATFEPARQAGEPVPAFFWVFVFRSTSGAPVELRPIR